MSNLIIEKLDELSLHITDGEHGSVKDDNTSNFYLLSNKNIVNGQILINDKDRRISEESFLKINKRTKLQKGDIVISTVGVLGKSAIVKDEINFDFQRSVGIIKVNPKKISNQFLYYYLNTKSVIKRINDLSKGAVQKCFFISDLKDLDIHLFSNLNTQQKIVKVLSDLDVKIELNSKINAELEAMAKTLYDYWFVQFDFPVASTSSATKKTSSATGSKNPEPVEGYKSSGGKMVWNEELKREIPEGWGVVKLADLGNFKNGVNYDPSNPGEIACPIINVRNISASSYFIKNSDLDVIYLSENDVRKYSVHKGSIIIARSGIPGATRLISDMEPNTLYCGFAIHYELTNLSNKLPIFFYLKSIEEMIKNGSGGTILKNVNQATLNNLKVALPKNEFIISRFNELIEPLFNKINLIEKENQELASLRDWLLPMLMNGQVTVGEVEEQLGMVAEPNEAYKKNKI